MDRLELYRWAVQDPETHAEVLRIMYEYLNGGRGPALLREEFAGTSADAVAWVALRPDRTAIAVDIDPNAVEWAKERAFRILGSLASRIRFVTDDVLNVDTPAYPAADILSVLNYSLLYAHDAEALHRYLAHAARCLSPGGILVANAFGGPDAMRARTDVHPVVPTPRLSTEQSSPPFEYVWEQRSYDSATGVADCWMHFRIEDPSSAEAWNEVRDSFHYEFRLWPPRTILDAMKAAGFGYAEVWRHTYDPAEGPDSLFLGPVPASELDALPHWTAYFVGRAGDTG